MRFQSAAEVARFEALLERYQRERSSGCFQWVSLASAYEFLLRFEDGGRAFALLLDLRFNVASLEHDLASMGSLVNSALSKAGSVQGPLLETPDVFFERLDLLKVTTSYILRYRAILDKVMALLVLLTASPKDYENFMSAKSRRRSFKAIATKYNRIPQALIDYIAEAVEAFDSHYRTAEAHGTGVARKWTFLENLGMDSPQTDMFRAWNSLHPLLTMVGKQFAPLEGEGA